MLSHSFSVALHILACFFFVMLSSRIHQLFPEFEPVTIGLVLINILWFIQSVLFTV